MASASRPPQASDPTSEAEIAPSEDADEAVEAESPGPDRAALSRAYIELQAAKSRIEKHAREVYDETRTRLIRELFPVLDNVDRTIRAAEHGGDAPAVVDGVRLVRAQLVHVLERYGVARIEVVLGQPFDPSHHEAIAVVALDDPDQDGAVIEQLEPGYVLGDKLLRPVRVVVGQYAQRVH
jgi:molecular chaperone GrpE